MRQAEALVKRASSVGKRKRSASRDAEIVAIEEKLQRIFATRVRVISGFKRGKIVIEFYSPSDLERLIGIIERQGLRV